VFHLVNISMAAQANVARRGSWKVVWCHERCHKLDCQTQSDGLQIVAQTLGGSVFYLKKAGGFAIWLSRELRHPYIVVTNWREAKPCISVIMQQNPMNHPSLVVVVCENQKQFSKASLWASEQVTCLVHVCTVFEPIHTFFAALAEQIGAVVLNRPTQANNTSHWRNKHGMAKPLSAVPELPSMSGHSFTSQFRDLNQGEYMTLPARPSCEKTASTPSTVPHPGTTDVLDERVCFKSVNTACVSRTMCSSESSRTDTDQLSYEQIVHGLQSQKSIEDSSWTQPQQAKSTEDPKFAPLALQPPWAPPQEFENNFEESLVRWSGHISDINSASGIASSSELSLLGSVGRDSSSNVCGHVHAIPSSLASIADEEASQSKGFTAAPNGDDLLVQLSDMSMEVAIPQALKMVSPKVLEQILQQAMPDYYDD